MSAQGAVSSTRRQSAPRAALIGALVLGIALGAAVALVTEGRRSASLRRIVARATSPSKALVALVTEQPCVRRFCQSLALGSSAATATALESLNGETADEVIWTSDSTRVGFVVDGYELWIYDAKGRKLAGRVGLLTQEAAQSRRARGVTFSENGRAVTFDDCPRAHSGCRAGVVGVPQ
jgi:hypothetical protein